MIPTLFSTRPERIHTIVDQQGREHTLEIIDDGVLLDGHPATIHLDHPAAFRLTTDADSVGVTTQALWYACVGAEPTADEAGQLLADSLVRWQEMQSLLKSFETAAQRMGSVLIPPYRMHPFLHQALLTFDGTQETTRLLARILQQEPEVVAAQAKQLGLSNQSQSALRKHEDSTQAMLVPCDEKSGAPVLAPFSPQQEKSLRPYTRFTETQVARMRTEYAQSTCIRDTIAALAQEFGCSEQAVSSKIYALHLPKKRQSSRRPRQTAEHSQEDDRSRSED